jgi:hypothetical protein
MEDDQQGVCFTGGLSPDEPAWKLRVEFSRKSGLLPNEIWSLKHIATNLFVQGTFMGHWPTNRSLAQTNLLGLNVDLAGVTQLKNLEGKDQLATLGFRFNPPSSEYHFALLEITDDKGRKLKEGSHRWGEGLCEFEVHLMEDSLALNVTVALHQSRFAEFLAKPELVKTSPGK